MKKMKVIIYLKTPRKKRKKKKKRKKIK